VIFKPKEDENVPVLISVVICTHNRAALLAEALRTLCEQALDSNEYEVIVVDNDSTDHTRSVTEEFALRFPNIRYCLETKIGLSHARNRGWQEARGEYVAYTDDDCKLPSQWLSVAKEIIEQKSFGLFGGPFFPFYDSPKPLWFKDSYRSLGFGDEARFLTKREDLIGNNLFIRRALLEKFGGFDASLGMNGKQIAYGEETELQMRMRKLMPDLEIFYDPRLYVYHLVRVERMKTGWLIREFFAKGRYVYMTEHGNDAPPFGRLPLLLRAIKVALEFLVDISYGVLTRNRGQYPCFQNYFYEHSSRYLRGWGRLYAQYRQITQRA
jgi:glycosyltransferase involved in cell wall biosynthesis